MRSARFACAKQIDVVIQHLRQEITQGALAPGTKIPPEGELTAQLGVSRTTLREAVVVLSHDGLVDVRQGDGTYVTAHPLARESLEQRLSRAEVLEVFELRRPLELEAARLAAMRRTDQDIERLRELLADVATAWRSGNTVEAVDLDLALHVAIAAASRSSVLADIYRTVARAAHLALAGSEHSVRLSDGSDLRSALVDAIAARDAGAAVRAAERLHEVDAEHRRRATGSDVPVAAASPSARRGPRAKHGRQPQS